MLRRVVATGALLLAGSVWSGCSLLMSVSKLVTTAGESVSKSLGSASDSFTATDMARLELDYRDDVRVATRQWLETGESSDAFLRELGRIAQLHGISHWEAEPGSLIAIGAGACQAGASESELSGIVASLGHEHADSQALAIEGCRTAAL